MVHFRFRNATSRGSLFEILLKLFIGLGTVILSDSKSALLAIVSDNNPVTQNILDCCHDLKNQVSIGKNIVLQWVPA
ncbi:hypothetical protein TNIN_186231 [Trichonephila inaurata madagascariensis]|uniref:Uncharacterized protein n=1 Tax=Trichonephila inaurata madagascariensis TaxID=2747483 RepID=A0A8X7CP85_9ARAC|nr:hypothetical protein TNIN_186231 [Trichonephila inaurata madagascariensis]